ncbi:MAG TPA: hypothetical protein VJ986_06730 [Gaiellaceae bacterium]|nr:hypothetical protein [Gaiellaceae bacterium]
MLKRFGPRTLVEAVFLIAVPIVIAVAGFGAITIIGGSALAYLLVLAAEIIESRDTGGARRPAAPAREMQPRPLVPEPEPAAVFATPQEHVRVVSGEESQPPPEPPTLERAPEPEPEPEREQPPVAAVPEPEPEPAPAPVVPEPTSVVPIGIGSAPRRWNLWQLEELVRASAGEDLIADEERNYLLLYLRDFADPSGELPLDFDGLVRESFGDLVGVR